MISHRAWKMVALSLAVSSPALADWRSDGNFRRKDVDSYEESAKAAEDRGFALGLGVGYGLPYGKAAAVDNGGELSEGISGVIPLQLDAGYYFNSHLYLGASFQYGLVSLEEDCTEGASCSASQLRFGVNLAYHFQPSEKLEPWVGVGIGYESFNTSLTLESGGVTGKIKSGFRGFEFISAQGGLDYRINKMFSVGPFVTFTVGQYSTVTSSIEVEGDDPLFDDADSSEDIDDKAIHGWIYGGVRMQVRF